jgi:hypothetical protein
LAAKKIIFDVNFRKWTSGGGPVSFDVMKITFLRDFLNKKHIFCSK